MGRRKTNFITENLDEHNRSRRSAAGAHAHFPPEPNGYRTHRARLGAHHRLWHAERYGGRDNLRKWNEHQPVQRGY
jgi:hypothetical protein